MSREISTQLFSGILSFLLHAALGVAVLWALDRGAPPPQRLGSEHGGVLVVELISYESEGSAIDPDAALDNPTNGSTADRALADPIAPSGPKQAEAAAPAPQSGSVRSSAIAGTATGELAEISSADMAAYRQRLETHLAEYRIYPPASRAAGREGVVMLHFVMTQDGEVIEAWVGESSGINDIDREAVAAVLRAQPLPAFPRGWPGRLSVVVPVTFRLG